VASLAPGRAVNELMLAPRAGQGLGGAVVAPAAPALLTTTFDVWAATTGRKSRPEGGVEERSSQMSVILINPFEVPEATNDEDFLRGWERAADYMRQQPGFVSTRLHRALRPEARFRFVNVAEWESPQDFQAAVGSEEFREIAGGGSPGSPALYEVVRST
jgi:heme-degrading monooxygenase HmoA